MEGRAGILDRPALLEEGWRRLGATDAVVIAWCVLLAAIWVLAAPGDSPGGPALACLTAAAGAAALAALHHRLPGPIRLLRRVHPLLLLGPAYLVNESLIAALHPETLDGAIRSAERALFGVEPVVALPAAFPQAWLVELMHAFYFSYYLLLAATGLALELADHGALARFLCRMSAAWILACAVQLVFPVAGPHVPDTGSARDGTPFVRLMGWIYLITPSYEGGAFPSSHVALAVACWASLRGRWPGLGRPLLLLPAGIGVSTVYCGYHYALDVLAGVACAALAIPVADRLFALLGPGTAAPRRVG